jgi:hypothetical protein
MKARGKLSKKLHLQKQESDTADVGREVTIAPPAL